MTVTKKGKRQLSPMPNIETELTYEQLENLQILFKRIENRESQEFSEINDESMTAHRSHDDSQDL